MPDDAALPWNPFSPSPEGDLGRFNAGFVESGFEVRGIVSGADDARSSQPGTWFTQTPAF